MQGLKKQIKISNSPATFIEIDADLDENEAREAWLLKHKKKYVNQASRSLETGLIRSAKGLYKKF